MFNPLGFKSIISPFIPHFSEKTPDENDLKELANEISTKSYWDKDTKNKAIKYFRKFPNLHKEIKDPELRMYTILFPYVSVSFPGQNERLWMLQKIARRLSELKEHQVDIPVLKNYLENDIKNYQLLQEVLVSGFDYDREMVLELLIKLGVNIKDQSLLLFCNMTHCWFERDRDLIAFLKTRDCLPDITTRNNEGKTALEFYVSNYYTHYPSYWEQQRLLTVVSKLIQHDFTCDMKYLSEFLRNQVGALLLPKPKLAPYRKNIDIPPQEAYEVMMRYHPKLRSNHSNLFTRLALIEETYKFITLIENGEWWKILDSIRDNSKIPEYKRKACAALSKGYINTNQFLTLNLIFSASEYMKDPDYFTEIEIDSSHDLESLRQSFKKEHCDIKVVSLAQNRLTISRKLKPTINAVLNNSLSYRFTAHRLPDGGMTILAHYFGLTEDEENALAIKLENPDIPLSEKFVFITRFPFSLAEFSPALNTNNRNFRPIRHGEIELKRYSEWIQPSLTICKLIQEMRHPEMNVKLNPIIITDPTKEVSKRYIPIFCVEDHRGEEFISPIGGAYAQMLFNLLNATIPQTTSESLESVTIGTPQKIAPAAPQPFVLIKESGFKLSFASLLNSDDREIRTAIDLINKIIEKTYYVVFERGDICFVESENLQCETLSHHEKRFMRILLAECKRRGFPEKDLGVVRKLSGEVDNSFDEVMRYRPKDKKYISLNSEIKRSIELAIHLNLGQWDQILPKPGLKDWRAGQVKDNLNLVYALKEGLISTEQLAMMNFIVMAYDVRFYETRYLLSDNNPWSVGFSISFHSASDVLSSFTGKDKFTTEEFMAWSKTPALLLKLKNEVQAYYPQVHPVFDEEGQIDEAVIDDIMHFYGLHFTQLDELTYKLRGLSIPLTDKLIIKLRVSNGLNHFAQILWAQKHKFTMNPGARYIFNPFRVHYDNEFKITELIIPSPAVHNIVLSLWNTTPHLPAYYFPPEEGGTLLPGELFEEKHRELKRPVQLAWVGNEGKMIRNIDGRMAGFELVACLHDIWHTLQDTFLRKEAHLMRDLIVESLPKDEQRNKLTDGEILWPIFSVLKPFDFSEFSKFVDDVLLRNPRWYSSHTEALVKGMVDREEDWKKAIGKCWRDLPQDHWLYDYCLTNSKSK